MGYQPSHGSAAHALRPGPEASGAARNRILLALSPQERARLLEMLQLVTFRLGDVLCEAGARMEYVYFPATCVVASLYTTEEGATAEMYLVATMAWRACRRSSGTKRRATPQSWSSPAKPTG